MNARKMFIELISKRIFDYFDAMKTIDLLSEEKNWSNYELDVGPSSFMMRNKINKRGIVVEVKGPGKRKLRAEISMRVNRDFNVRQHLSGKKYIAVETEDYITIKSEISQHKEIDDYLMLLTKM